MIVARYRFLKLLFVNDRRVSHVSRAEACHLCEDGYAHSACGS